MGLRLRGAGIQLAEAASLWSLALLGVVLGAIGTFEALQ